MTVRVLIADDHPVFREGLRAVLSGEPGIDVVGDCGSGTDAVRLAAELRPDVVLMDLRMPGLDGVGATRRIVADGTAAVVVLTTYETNAHILEAIEAGALGYLLKDASGERIADAVRAAARRETVLAGPVAAALAEHVRRPRTVSLTGREREVLQQVALGLSNPEIGRVLFIGESTVKSHLLRIFEKLGVGDRTAAVTAAIAGGILPPPGG
jgi:DNA-binding NarL/FixJ family response regulator